MNGNLVNKRSTPLLHPKLSFLHRPQKKHGLSHSLCRALQQQPAPSTTYTARPSGSVGYAVPRSYSPPSRDPAHLARGARCHQASVKARLAKPGPYAPGVPVRLHSSYSVRAAAGSSSFSGSTSTMMFNIALSSHSCSSIICTSNTIVTSKMYSF